MDEQELRELIAAVKARRVSRRTFVRRMVDLGLTAPLAVQLLVHAGLAQSPKSADYKPTRAGGGGVLRTLFWQAPTLLNPHFAVGVKDVEAAGIFTSRCQPGIPTETWFRCSLPRFRMSRTAGSL